MKAFRSSLMLVLAALSLSLVVQAQPDVIVGELTGPSNYSADGTFDAFSLGTTSCNKGTQVLTWIASTNQHPVIGGNLFKIENGRFLHIGRSWLKHGFTALQGNTCNIGCNPNPNGSALGVGCSDPYGSGLNGNQSPLGPRYQVNASTGFFNYPPANPSWSGSTDRRLKVRLADLAAAPGTLFVTEGQYIQPEDAMANADDNNASYRMGSITGGPTDYSLSFVGSTQREMPGIQAWPDNDPGVAIVDAMDATAGGGRYIVAAKRSDSGDPAHPHRFVIAIHNLNVDNSAGGFTVNFPAGSSFATMGMHSAEYNDGEPFNNNSWAATTTGSGIQFNVDQLHAVNPNSNAIRWGSCFTFWFDCSNSNPTGMALESYKTVGNVTIPPLNFPAPQWQTNQANASLGIDSFKTNDPFIGPVEETLGTSAAYTIEMASAAGFPMNVGVTAVPGVAALLTLPSGQFVNIDVTSPTFSLLWPVDQVLPSGSLSVPIITPATSLFAAMQLYTVDPSSSDGVRLSALNEVDVQPLPRVIVEAVGGNSFNADTSNGFWRVHHTGTSAANVTSVKFDFAGGQSSVTGYVFDTDQSGMAGVFNQGGTYRNNSAALSGLDFSVSSPFAGSGFIATNGAGGANFRTVEFQFTGGLFNGRTFEFDADTDPNSNTSGTGMAGTAITVDLSDGTHFTGFLSSDGTRSFVEVP